MPNYKDANGKLHFLDSVEFEYILPKGCLEISDAEAEAIRLSERDLVAEKAQMLEIGRTMREAVMNRLNGIAGRMQRSGDTVSAAACDNAVTELLALPTWPDVVAATDGPTTKAAFLARYYQIASDLQTASPYAYTAFKDQDL